MVFDWHIAADDQIEEASDKDAVCHRGRVLCLLDSALHRLPVDHPRQDFGHTGYPPSKDNP